MSIVKIAANAKVEVYKDWPVSVPEKKADQVMFRALISASSRAAVQLSRRPQLHSHLGRVATFQVSPRSFSSDDKVPPRGTGNEDEYGRQEPWIPEYEDKFHEASEDKRQRLLYQVSVTLRPRQRLKLFQLGTQFSHPEV